MNRRARWSGGATAIAVACIWGCAEGSVPGGEEAVLSSHDDGAARDRDDAGTEGVREAPAPDRLSEEQVREELARLPTELPEGVRDFQRLLRMIPAAQTSLALQWTMAHAADIAQDRPGRSSQAFLRRLQRELEGVLVDPGFGTGIAQTAECHVGFDNPASLAALPDAAAWTYSDDPHYFEPCRTGFIRFEPLNYGHYHLVYEDPNINCFDEDWMFGRTVDGVCVALADPAQEPRQIGAHLGPQVIRVRYQTGFGFDLPLPFALRYFINVGGEPVRIRFRNTDGEWFGWNSLAGQTLWVLGANAVNIEELFITHADTALDCGPDWGFTAAGSTCPVGGPPFFVDHFGIEP
jgi:hypothetical protein